MVDGRETITIRECTAMRLLARDGWSTGVLKMIFETTNTTARKHVTGGCDHKDYVTPLSNDWNGRNPPQKQSSDKRIIRELENDG